MGKMLRDMNSNKNTLKSQILNTAASYNWSTNAKSSSKIETNQSLRKIPMFQSKNLEEVNHWKRRNSTEELKKQVLEVKPNAHQKKFELSSSIIDILKHVDKIISTSSVKNQQTCKTRGFNQRSQTKREQKNKSPKNSVRWNIQQKMASEIETIRKKMQK